MRIELTPTSRSANRIQKNDHLHSDHLRSQISWWGGDGEKPFSDIGAARLTTQQHVKARFRNSRENNFACARFARSRSRLPPAESHSDFLPQGYCRSCEKHATWLPFTDDMFLQSRRCVSCVDVRRSGSKTAIIRYRCSVIDDTILYERLCK